MTHGLELSSFDRVHVATGAPLSKPGGLNAVVRELAEAQSALGLNSVVVHGISRRGMRDASIWRPEVRGQLHSSKRAQPLHDGPFVQFHFAPTARPILQTTMWGEVPRVFFFHGPWFKEGAAQGNGRLRIVAKEIVERRAYRAFDTFIAASQAFAVELTETFKIPDANVRVVHPGINTTAFSPGDKSSSRQILKLDKDAYIFGIVRRLEPRMGIDLAIRSLAAIPNATLAIAGQGSRRQSLEALSKTLGVENRVTFLGKLSQDNVPAFYRSMDATLVPSRALEGFGLVVLESFGCGIPVIAAGIGGLPEAMGPWASQWTFKPESVPELKDKMKYMMTSPPAHQDLIEYARGRSWRSSALKIEDYMCERLKG